PPSSRDRTPAGNRDPRRRRTRARAVLRSAVTTDLCAASSDGTGRRAPALSRLGGGIRTTKERPDVRAQDSSTGRFTETRVGTLHNRRDPHRGGRTRVALRRGGWRGP